MAQMEQKTIGREPSVFKVVENECIWMKAGVINFRICDNAYDCQSCPFDKGMRKALSQGKEKSGTQHQSKSERVHWSEKMKKYPGHARLCRHNLTGRIEAKKICPYNYECYHCEFDQMLDQLHETAYIDKPTVHFTAGFRLADGYYYHLGHSWARIEYGGRVRIGLDEFSMKLLGTPDRIVLPSIGKKTKQGEPELSITRDSNVAAVLAPFSGTVLCTNQRALDQSEIVHDDPYSQGWLMLIEPVRLKKDLKGLFFEKESDQWIDREVQQLMGLIGQTPELLASTGGEAVNDIIGHFPELGWDTLVHEFLHT